MRGSAECRTQRVGTAVARKGVVCQCSCRRARSHLPLGAVRHEVGGMKSQ